VCVPANRPAGLEFRDGGHGLASGDGEFLLLENRAFEPRLLCRESDDNGGDGERGEHGGLQVQGILLSVMRKAL